jgi:hypothetical protein
MNLSNRPETAAARSCLYRTAAALLHEPDDGTRAEIADPRLFEAARRAAADLGLPERIGSLLDAIEARAKAGDCTPEHFHRVFSHTVRGRCSPYEAEYDLPEGGDRARRFRPTAVEFFREFGFERICLEAAHRFPRVARETSLFVHSVASRQEDGDLLLRDDRKTAVLRFPPARFLDPASLADFLHGELQHIEDMLGPVFGYDPDWKRRSGVTGKAEREREAFRILWDLSVAVRLSRRGLRAVEIDEERGRFAASFPALGRATTDRIVGALLAADPLTHARILDLAKDLSAAVATACPAGRRRQGGVCPVCTFPSHDWDPAPAELAPGIPARLIEFRPAWTPDDGVCGQCVLVACAHTPLPEATARPAAAGPPSV